MLQLDICNSLSQFGGVCLINFKRLAQVSGPIAVELIEIDSKNYV